jgi:hypothetical protein
MKSSRNRRVEWFDGDGCSDDDLLAGGAAPEPCTMTPLNFRVMLVWTGVMVKCSGNSGPKNLRFLMQVHQKPQTFSLKSGQLDTFA